MRTIETTAVVTPERTVTVQLPADFPPGPCRVVVIPAPPSAPDGGESIPLDLPIRDLGPWPEGFTVSREQIYGDDGR